MDTPDSTCNLLLKQCTTCKQFKPANKEVFRVDKRNPNGLAAMCRECNRAYYQQSEVKEREKKRKSTPEYKVKEKAYKSTPEYRARENELARTPEHRAKENERRHIRLEQDPEYREKLRILGSSPQKRAYGREYQRKRRQDPEFVAREREYKKDPLVKEIYRIATRRRRARKRGLPDNFTVDDWRYCLEYFHYRCVACGRQLDDLFGTHRASADHWTPLKSPECTGTIPENIVPLCSGKGGCNNSKSHRNAEEWLVNKFGRRKANEILARIQEYFAHVKS